MLKLSKISYTYPIVWRTKLNKLNNFDMHQLWYNTSQCIPILNLGLRSDLSSIFTEPIVNFMPQRPIFQRGSLFDIIKISVNKSFAKIKEFNQNSISWTSWEVQGLPLEWYMHRSWKIFREKISAQVLVGNFQFAKFLTHYQILRITW